MSYRHALRGLMIAAFALVLAAPMAAAHVTVDPGEAAKGGFATLKFRVPNERDDASTTQLEVNLPTDTPIRSVRVQPKPGWSYELEETTLDEPIETEGGDEITEVVSKITWNGGEITPGEFDEFGVSLGPLPEEADQIFFPALQTYDSGEVVRWIEEPAEDGSEPETPAPMLRLVEGGDDPDAAASDDETEEEEAATSGDAVELTVENAATQDDVDGASTLGIVGIVIGAVGLLTAGFTLVLLRRRSA
jgi:uncharacterized protein YcnI